MTGIPWAMTAPPSPPGKTCCGFEGASRRASSFGAMDSSRARVSRSSVERSARIRPLAEAGSGADPPTASPSGPIMVRLIAAVPMSIPFGDSSPSRIACVTARIRRASISACRLRHDDSRARISSIASTPIAPRSSASIADSKRPRGDVRSGKIEGSVALRQASSIAMANGSPSRRPWVSSSCNAVSA